MYHAFVRRQIHGFFNAINAGKAASVLTAYAHDFEHRCVGQHALGGKRTQLGPMLDWYARLYRLLPGIHFTITSIHVSGGPWDTLAMVEWSVRYPHDEDNSLEDNTGVHMLHLRWGRMLQVVICPHADAFSAPLSRLARAGVAEAGAAPIV